MQALTSHTNMSWSSIRFNMFPGIPWPCSWCFLSTWVVMAVCTPRLPTPTTTRWDQRPHTGWAQWWVDNGAGSCASRSPVVSSFPPPVTLTTPSANRPVCTGEDTTASLRTEAPLGHERRSNRTAGWVTNQPSSWSRDAAGLGASAAGETSLGVTPPIGEAGQTGAVNTAGLPLSPLS